MANDNKPFGNILTKENYLALRSLARKLTYKEFHLATGFGHGIHNRLRRFPEIEQYREYIKVMRDKSRPRSTQKRVTLQDIHKEILEIKGLLSR